MSTTMGSAPLRTAQEQPTTANRWFGVGRSVDSDARTAGAEAAAAALNGRQAALLVVFCPFTIDALAMLEGVRAESGDVPLIGCTGLAVLDPTGAGQAVVVSALGGDGFDVRTSVATNLSADQRAAGELVAESVHGLTREHKMLLLLCDGLAGEQHEMVRGAYSVVGATIPLAGGCAADDFTYRQTFQFYADSDGVHVYTDAVVAAAIGSDAVMGVGIAHGWHKVGEPMVATSSTTGGTIRTLDGEPALDMYRRRIGFSPEVADDPQAFALIATGHPIGMSRRSGEDMRVIHAANPAEGSISCLADVPQGALVWTMESDRAALVGGANDAYDDMIKALDGAPPLGFLTFDCGSRYLVLEQDGVREEIDGIASRAAGVPFAGFYTYGEIARTRGARGMHNLTVVMAAFA
jgi:hypothetical protein